MFFTLMTNNVNMSCWSKKALAIEYKIQLKSWIVGLCGLAIIHFFIQLFYVMIQRYNLPRFIQLRKRLVKCHDGVDK